MSRRTFINLITFNVVFVVCAWWAVNNIVSFDFIERPYRITGEFEAAAGVAANSEVTYLGVHYGSVDGVDLTEEGVEVRMKIDRGKEIPAGSIARIFRKSAVGEPYIDFVPPADHDRESTDTIQPGDHVPIERTTVPLEFSEMLRSASRLISGIDPQDARVLVHELSLALDGRSDALRELTAASDQIVASLAERTDQLDRLTENNTRLTRVFAEHRGSLGSAITDLRDLASSLRAADGDTAAVLDRGTELIGRAADLIAAEKANLDCALSDLDQVIRLSSSDAQLANLRHVLEAGPTGFNYVFMSRDDDEDGVWVRVNLLVDPESPPPPQYVPPHELPEVPTVPACVSDLSSSGLRFRDVPGGGRVPAGALPATGGQPLVALGLILLAGALAAAVTGRRAGRARR